MIKVELLKNNIVIDLDNTIINYANSFRCAAEDLGIDLDDNLSPKVSLKNKIFNSKVATYDQNSLWLKAQHLAYVTYLKKAHIEDDYYLVYNRLLQLGFNIHIISHKSTYSYFDSKTLLRPLIHSNFTHLGDITFCETLEKKIESINELSPILIIDDLSTVLDHFVDQKNTLLIHFGEQTGSKRLLGQKSWRDIFNLTQSLFFENEKSEISYEILNVNSKNQILIDYQLARVIKIFPSPVTETERATREFCHLRLLQPFSPSPLFCFSNHVGIQYLPPEPYTIENALSSIKSLVLATCTSVTSSLKMTDPIISSADSVEKLLCRTNVLRIDKLLKSKLISKIKKAEQLFSFHSSCDYFCLPDLSLSNIVFSNNKFYVIDLECSGMGDICKAIASLSLHPAHQKNIKSFSKLQKELIAALKKTDDTIEKRFLQIYPYIYLEWILILLNIVHPIRCNFKESSQNESVFSERYANSIERLEQFDNMVDNILNFNWHSNE